MVRSSVNDPAMNLADADGDGIGDLLLLEGCVQSVSHPRINAAAARVLDRLWELGLDAGYSVLKQADVYVGWRTVKADFKNDGTERMDTGFHVGLRVRF